MRKQLLTTFGVSAIGMISYATTFMQVKTYDGEIVKFDLEKLIEVDFISDDPPADTIPFSPTYVDLGLTSGLLWATCNIGATKPEEYGDYFAWGETEPKQVYDWSTYKWGEDVTKYNSNDGLRTLLPEDDAATVGWGSEWRMPTKVEFRELKNECYKVWTNNYNGNEVNGVIFYKAKNANDKGKFICIACGETPSSEYSTESDVHIFFPFAGYFNYSDVTDEGGIGILWSSSLYEDYNILAYDFTLSRTGGGYDSYSRFDGFPVRAVYNKK